MELCCVCACANSTRFRFIYICYPLIAVIVHHLNGRCSSDFTRGLCRRFQCRPHDVQSLAKCQPIGRYVLTNGRMYYKTHAIRNISLVHRGTFYTLIPAF